MSQIEVIRPSGMTVSASTTWSAAGYSYMSTFATWTPSSSVARAHVLCFMAIESVQRYFILKSLIINICFLWVMVWYISAKHIMWNYEQIKSSYSR